MGRHNKERSTSTDSEKLEVIKQKADQSMKEGQYMEAFLYWSQAIHINPEEPLFYSQRSKCFIKQEQYYHALLDADILIRMSPESCLGYLRKAEVFYAVHDFASALELFQLCFQMSHWDKEFYMDWVKRCQRELVKETALDDEYPFVGAAVGIVVSAIGVVVDTLWNQDEPWLPHPFLKVTMVLTVSFLAFFVCKMYRKFKHRSHQSLLDPPLDLFDQGEDPVEQCDSNASLADKKVL